MIATIYDDDYYIMAGGSCDILRMKMVVLEVSVVQSLA